MSTVRFGNHAAFHEGEIVPGDRVTTILVPAHDSFTDAIANITSADGLWARSSAADPDWVACDDRELETALADHYGCPVGEPGAALIDDGLEPFAFITTT